MILTFFEKLVLGHFVGDYLLQNNWIALNKSKKWLPCLTHILIYTLAICVATWAFNPWWILVVVLSHLPIDRWSLAEKWLKFTKGRTLEGFIKSKQTVIKNDQIGGTLVHNEPCTAMDSLQAGFSTFVYIVVDNTFHILLMVAGMYLLKFIGVM